MAKETAHQIGTPLSSLIGWIELIKNKENCLTNLSGMWSFVFWDEKNREIIGEIKWLAKQIWN